MSDSDNIDMAVSQAKFILKAYREGTISAEDTAKNIAMIWQIARRVIRDKPQVRPKPL